MNLGISFAPLVPSYVVWAAFAAAALISVLLLLVRSRGAPLRALALGLMVLALVSLTQLPPGFALPDLVWRLVLMGIGQGMFMSPNSSAVLGSVPGRRVGTASGTLAQMRVTGQTLGIALSVAIVATRLPVYLPGAASPGVALASAIHDAFWVAAFVCAIGIATSLVRGSGRAGRVDEPRTEEPAVGGRRLGGIPAGDRAADAPAAPKAS